MPIFHGARPILGLRLGGFAYLTDCSRIPDESWPLLEGLDVLVLDALRERPHPTHFSLSRGDRGDRADRAAPRATSRTCATTSATRPPAPGCRREWSWPMMAWSSKQERSVPSPAPNT